MFAFVSVTPILGTKQFPNHAAIRELRRPVWTHPVVAKANGFGPMRRLRDAILRPLVSVPGSNLNEDLIDCVFCDGSGQLDCDSCDENGRDALGVCMICDGKAKSECHVCSGVGLVDRIRVGGTDDNRDWALKNKGVVKGKRKNL